MEILLDLIAVIGFAVSCFSFGYFVGKDSNKTQK